MLSVCPTPIGNMGDITLRVLETLRAADLVAAEDTRRTGRLLAHFGIDKPLISFFEHNELRRLPELLARIREGAKVALVSDAGMPGICDPGYRLIRTALDEGLPVEVLPGPSAIETALVASGYATDSFAFVGYLPRKKGDRERALTRIAGESTTCVAFETPHRLRATLEQAAALMGDREVAVCREMTKRFEEILRGTPSEVARRLPDRVRGEVVLVFEPAAPAAAGTDEEAIIPVLARLRDEGLSARRAAEIVASLTGMTRNEAYRLALTASGDE